MNFKTRRILISAGGAIVFAALLACACTRLRYNDFRRYGRDTGLSWDEMVQTYGEPTPDLEWAMSLSNAAFDEDWDRLEKLTQKDRRSELGTYFRNLAKAKKGLLSEELMSYYQPFERALFLPVGEKSGRFIIAQSGEVWWQLGENTMAEHSAILGLSFSKNKCGRRFLQRLGEINKVWGDEAAAAKYFNLAGCGSKMDEEELARRRSLMQTRDEIHPADALRPILKSLLEASPDNETALEYLLCLDLLLKDLPSFVEDWTPQAKHSEVYQQAALIWMAYTGEHDDSLMDLFGITPEVFERFKQFTMMYGKASFKQMEEQFADTYWFYFKYAKRNEG